jgi:hypothetical protein
MTAARRVTRPAGLFARSDYNHLNGRGQNGSLTSTSPSRLQARRGEPSLTHCPSRGCQSTDSVLRSVGGVLLTCRFPELTMRIEHDAVPAIGMHALMVNLAGEDHAPADFAMDEHVGFALTTPGTPWSDDAESVLIISVLNIQRSAVHFSEATGVSGCDFDLKLPQMNRFRARFIEESRFRRPRSSRSRLSSGAHGRCRAAAATYEW